jgi:hypothetical protein
MQESIKKISGDIWEALGQLKERLIDNFIIQFLFRNCPPGDNSFKKLIENNTNSPGITAKSILIIPEGLWRHVDRRAYIVLAMLMRVFGWDGESKIADLIHALLEEDVGRFDVSVQVAAFVHVVVSSDDLLDDLAGFVVAELFFCF